MTDLRLCSHQPDTSRSCRPWSVGLGAIASCGVCVYLPAFACTKLYCLMTEAVGYKKLDRVFSLHTEQCYGW